MKILIDKSAQHFFGAFLLSFSLTTANDIGFNNLFKRNLEALANPNDLLIVFSTSGNSKNILKVVKFAKSKNIKIISFLGNKGGNCKGLSDLDLIVPHKNVARIQAFRNFLFSKIGDWKS